MIDQSDNDKTLAELLPADMFIGTSLILREDPAAENTRYLYGIRPGKVERQLLVLELTGIGGKLDEEDSSAGVGAIREAQEEIACAVRLIPSSLTLLIKGHDDISLIDVAGPEKPLAIIYRYFGTPPHKPWHSENQGPICQVIFLGEVQGRPRPDHEMPNLVWLPPRLILEASRRDVPLGELLMAGAALVPGRNGSPPLDSRARMTDSQEALALALGDKTPSFFQGLYQEQFPLGLFDAHSRKEAARPAQDVDSDLNERLMEGDVLLPEETDEGAAGGPADQPAESIQLEATGAVLDQTRQEIRAITAKIDELIERTGQLEHEIRQLRENKSQSKNPLSRLWDRLRPRSSGQGE